MSKEENKILKVFYVVYQSFVCLLKTIPLQCSSSFSVLAPVFTLKSWKSNTIFNTLHNETATKDLSPLHCRLPEESGPLPQ